MVDWRSSRGSDADRAHFFIAVPRIKISLSREALGFMLLVRRSDQQHRFVSFEWAAPDATASRPAPSRKAHNETRRGGARGRHGAAPRVLLSGGRGATPGGHRRAATTRHSRRSRASSPTCWAGPQLACRLTAAWSSSSRWAARRSCRCPIAGRDSRPVKRLSDGELSELRAQLIDLLDRGWVQHSTGGHAVCALAGRVVAHLLRLLGPQHRHAPGG